MKISTRFLVLGLISLLALRDAHALPGDEPAAGAAGSERHAIFYYRLDAIAESPHFVFIDMFSADGSGAPIASLEDYERLSLEMSEGDPKAMEVILRILRDDAMFSIDTFAKLNDMNIRGRQIAAAFEHYAHGDMAVLSKGIEDRDPKLAEVINRTLGTSEHRAVVQGAMARNLPIIESSDVLPTEPVDAPEMEGKTWGEWVADFGRRVTEGNRPVERFNALIENVIAIAPGKREQLAYEIKLARTAILFSTNGAEILDRIIPRIDDKSVFASAKANLIWFVGEVFFSVGSPTPRSILDLRAIRIVPKMEEIALSSTVPRDLAVEANRLLMAKALPAGAISLKAASKIAIAAISSRIGDPRFTKIVSKELMRHLPTVTNPNGDGRHHGFHRFADRGDAPQEDRKAGDPDPRAKRPHAADPKSRGPKKPL